MADARAPPLKSDIAADQQTVGSREGGGGSREGEGRGGSIPVTCDNLARMPRFYLAAVEKYREVSYFLVFHRSCEVKSGPERYKRLATYEGLRTRVV